MQVKFFATYREITHCSLCQLPAPADVHALLHELAERWPALRAKVLTADGQNLGADAIVMVNGRHIEHLQGLSTPLSETDVAAVFPMVAGG